MLEVWKANQQTRKDKKHQETKEDMKKLLYFLAFVLLAIPALIIGLDAYEYYNGKYPMTFKK